MDTNQPPSPTLPKIETTKQLAALRQITAAIQHLSKREYECAITLAAAAEGLLPPTDESLFSAMKELIPPDEFKHLDFNMVVNWLKHYKPEDQDPFLFPESEPVMLIQRAISKFIAVYHQSTKLMEAFMKWASTRHGYPEPRP